MSDHAKRAHRHALHALAEMGLDPAKHEDALAEMLDHAHLKRVFAITQAGGPDEAARGDVELKRAVAVFYGALRAVSDHCTNRGMKMSAAAAAAHHAVGELVDDLGLDSPPD